MNEKNLNDKCKNDENKNMYNIKNNTKIIINEEITNCQAANNEITKKKFSSLHMSYEYLESKHLIINQFISRKFFFQFDFNFLRTQIAS